MALVHTIPTTDATIPPPVRQSGNGTLPTDWLRSFDGSTATAYKMFAPVSYAMQAMILAALLDGIRLTTTGRYRSYAQQESLFLARYSPGPFDPAVHRTKPSIQSRTYAGRVWFLRIGMAMAATPGTSNHGWGIADDICEAPAYPGGPLISIRGPALQWLKDNAHRFGFALDTHEEPWHWHWYRPGHVCELTQDTVDVLRDAGITVPDLATFGFTAPAPTPLPEPDPQPEPQEDDDMARTFIGRRQDNGKLMTSLEGTVAVEHEPGAQENIVLNLLQKGVRDYYNPKRRDEQVMPGDEIPVLDGSWVVAMGRVLR